MNRSLTSTLALCLLACATTKQCGPDPINPVPDASTGGSSAATGGASSTGGEASQGGSVATGGALAVLFPECVRTFKAAQHKRYPLGRLHALGARKLGMTTFETAPAAYDLSSVFRAVNDKDPLAQIGGSCTGNDAIHVVSTHPFTRRALEADAMAVYDLATTIDPFPGCHAKTCKPIEDTGSDGQSALDALIQLGFTVFDDKPLKSYVLAANYETGVTKLHQTGCLFDSDWTDTAFDFDSCGLVVFEGAAIGGHSREWLGHDAATDTDWFRNSWGPDWGIADRAGNKGMFAQKGSDTRALLQQGGAIICPVIP